MTRILTIFLLAVCALSGTPIRVPLTVQEEAGIARVNGQVTSGVPFSMGVVSTNSAWRLHRNGGREIPLQTETTGTWRDGSLKWLLLDFQIDARPGEMIGLTLENSEKRPERQRSQSISFQDTPSSLQVDTGPLRFEIPKNRFGLFEKLSVSGKSIGINTLSQSIEIYNPNTTNKTSSAEIQKPATQFLEIGAPEEVKIEETGPLHGVIKISGWCKTPAGQPLIQYLFRIHCFAGSSGVKVDHTFIQMADKPGILWVRDLGLVLHLSDLQNYSFGGNAAVHEGALNGQTVKLTQLQENHYSFGDKTEGLRAQGWVKATSRQGSFFLGIKDSWQQFPKALQISSNEVRIALYPREETEPFDMDQGLAKTHQLLFQFSSDGEQQSSRELIEAAWHPLFASAPVQWYCDSKVFGDLAPFNFDLFPDYETLTEASGDQFIKGMATGLRHWGDMYFGGEYKGKNSFMNLEYDATTIFTRNLPGLVCANI